LNFASVTLLLLLLLLSPSKQEKMTQTLECLTSLDSSWKQKNQKKMKLFSFEKREGGGVGREDCLNHA
jgi:hypothetical protein